jgi:hypothetical protein
MRLVAPFLLLILTGCTQLEVVSPSGVDLSGTWELDRQHSDMRTLAERPPPPETDDRDVSGYREPPASPGGLTPELSPREMDRGPMPRLPMLTATQMTISQDDTSMGIDYPGQPYRDLKWGRQEHGLFIVEAGWEEGLLIVQTSSSPLHVRETYMLSDDGTTLTLQIELSGRAMDAAHLIRVFTRKPSTPT